MSLREIERRTGISKTKLRSTLSENGTAIRSFRRNQKMKYDLAQIMRSGKTPYGYAYLEGKLVVDPHEYKVLLEIYRRWRSGEGLRAICRVLNDRGVKPRTGKSWKHNTIKQMIERHERELMAASER